jgi:hypothetical protein
MQLTYTATGIRYNGRPFIPDGSSGAYFGEAGAAGPHMGLQPVAPAPATLTSGTAYRTTSTLVVHATCIALTRTWSARATAAAARTSVMSSFSSILSIR